MQEALYSSFYQADLEYIRQFKAIDWERLQGKRIVLSGATGQIGSCLVDALMQKNLTENFNCRVICLTRNIEKARMRFFKWLDCALDFEPADVTSPCDSFWQLQADYVLHLASNTHPIAYASDPIGTIKTNIVGTDNLLKLATLNAGARFLLASSNEIYGENRGDTDLFDETYCGDIDCNTLRAGYPESKRCSEALVQAYRAKYGLCSVIARLTRTYGPTLRPDDSKALTQFIKNAVNGEDIVLKSAGNQYYSYTYVADAVTGLLTVLTKGEDGEAYNIAEPGFDVRLAEVAEMVAKIGGSSVRIEKAGSLESRGFSKVTTCRLDNKKIVSLGWKASYPLEKGLLNTIRTMRDYAQDRFE